MEDAAVWAVFYSGVVAIQYHPSNPPDKRMSLEDCALVADGMLQEYYFRFRRD